MCVVLSHMFKIYKYCLTLYGILKAWYARAHCVTVISKIISTCLNSVRHPVPFSSWFSLKLPVLSLLWFCQASPAQPRPELAAPIRPHQAPVHCSAELEAYIECSSLPAEVQWWKLCKETWALEEVSTVGGLWWTSGRPPEMRGCTVCPGSCTGVEMRSVETFLSSLTWIDSSPGQDHSPHT